MKFQLLITAAILLSGIFFGFGQSNEINTFDCFSILVGKDASADGSVMFAHNEDDWGDRIVNIFKVPVAMHKPGETVQMKGGGDLSQPEKTGSYLWLEMPEMEFSDTYMNEWGVTIASDACLSREKNPEITDGGIGYWLRRGMAERAHSARDAVKIGGVLVEQYGYTSSGRTYCIADANEAWMMAVVNGKHWVAKRVPDDQVAIIPNYYTITSIDLSDTMNYYGSTDLIEYAAKNNWYDPEEDGKFNFRLAYSDPGNLENMGNIVRHWSAINHLFSNGYEIEDEFPFSYKPGKKIELTDLFQVLRNHNEGSKYDESEGYAKGNPHEFGRAICSSTTQYGFVAQLRKDLPKEIAYVLWLAPFRPCVHPFTPWYFGMSDMPGGFAESNYRKALETHFNPIENVFEFAPDNKFLEFVKDAKKVDENYGEQIDQIREQINRLEKEILQNQKTFEDRLLKMEVNEPDKLSKSVNEFSMEQLEKSMEMIK
ncbi:MAG: C69 family dipeptidase [Bacteroidales bacterium]|nr:C69 family dipeptidase [Bacteroidales bacterium]